MSNALASRLVDDPLVNLACFEVKGQTYAVDVAEVREIVRIHDITPLPNAPRLIEGVIDMRGVVIPVLDLAKVFGRGTGDTGMHARIVILEFGGLVMGLWVDSATDVLSLESSRLENIPELARQAGYAAVRHIVRRAEQPPVMVLALENLVEKVDRSALAGSGAAGEGR